MVLFERRKLKRFHLAVTARIETVNPWQKTQVYYLTTSNVCAGGAYFKTWDFQPKGTPVAIELIVPLKVIRRFGGNNELVLSCAGKVLRCETTGMAIEFDGQMEIRPRSKVMPAGISENGHEPVIY